MPFGLAKSNRSFAAALARGTISAASARLLARCRVYPAGVIPLRLSRAVRTANLILTAFNELFKNFSAIFTFVLE